METLAITPQVHPPQKTPKTRNIGRNHLAFFRAYLQGIDGMQMWARYMDVYGPAELRTVRSTLHWLRTEFIMAARQAGQPRLAVLLKRDPNLMPAGDAPTIDEFAARYPPGFYTQTELDALYGEEFGKGGTGGFCRITINKTRDGVRSHPLP